MKCLLRVTWKMQIFPEYNRLHTPLILNLCFYNKFAFEIVAVGVIIDTFRPKPKEKEKFINLLSQNEHISKIIFKLYSKLCNIAMIEILPLWSLQNLIYFSTKDSAQSSLHSQYFIDKRKWCIKMVRNIALGSDQSNIDKIDDFYQFNHSTYI